MENRKKIVHLIVIEHKRPEFAEHIVNLIWEELNQQFGGDVEVREVNRFITEV